MGAIALILIVIASLSAFTNGLDSVWSDFVNTHDQFDFYECVENHYCNATIANQVLVDAGSTFTVGSWNGKLPYWYCCDSWPESRWLKKSKIYISESRLGDECFPTTASPQ